MSICNGDLSNFEIEIDKALENVSEHQSQELSIMEHFEQSHSLIQPKNEIIFGGDNQHLKEHHQFTGVEIRNVGGITNSSENYSDTELHKYLNFDSTAEFRPRESLENRKTQVIDEFFDDFYEIISSEMKSSSSYQQEIPNTSTDVLAFDDQSKHFNATDSGVDFNLDMSQFYNPTHESDFLNSMLLQSPDLRTDFSSVMTHNQPPQHDALAYHDSNVIGNNSESAAQDHSNESVPIEEFLHDSADTTDNGHFNQFYVDFKVNGDMTSGSNDNNSVITYINKDVLQSVEYINESGQTETVMYLDQQPNIQQYESNGADITQYEIIDFNAYEFHTDNNESVQPDYLNDSSAGKVTYLNDEVTLNGDSLVVDQQPDILSSLLLDKNNNIIIIAKPLRNPKIKQSHDEFYSKFKEIDSNPTKISFSKRPKVKGNRKQKLETINQIDSVVTKRGRPSKISKTMMETSTFIPETPKLPSKFVRDRKNKVQMGRKRPRKLSWDSESDCDYNKNCIGSKHSKEIAEW